ncbi:hypothetical protein N7481_004057 [Penicillium waksmanii]|uniref:uncharacterized protein n=1 Tax=Penicillium waksmanii TaxID=69791 RepID=UPI0025467DD9|nr:uncharacterized protein N7481_004057 [Penicillium waksmanii]KAJ5988847.1 hypothetical protein N7481_004057 [Penicillium waksmanii]
MGNSSHYAGLPIHGTGFPKELYEPLWDDLLTSSNKHGARIRSIWIADAANQGASGVLNEQDLENDPSWYDISRDVIHMINHFRDQMPRPIVGVGHSLGATQLLFASLFHPRLFTSLALIEPHMTDDPLAGGGPMLPSREAAIEKAGKAFKTWDRRVFELWKRFEYRDLPTCLYPEKPANGTRPVTLTTTKRQETMMYTRPNVKRHTQRGAPEGKNYTDLSSSEIGPPHDSLLFPDVLGALSPTQKSYRPESSLGFKLLPHIRPSVLYLGALDSTLGKTGVHLAAAKLTGTGFGGSGGLESGRVQYSVIQKADHFLPQEKVIDTGHILGSWLSQKLQRWQEDEARVADGWREWSGKEKSSFQPEWKELVESIADLSRQSKV